MIVEWRRKFTHAAPAVAVFAGWLACFAKVGAGRVVGLSGALEQINKLPHALHYTDSSLNYPDYSVLPAVVSRILGATTAYSNTALQTILMVILSIVIVALVSVRSPNIAWLAVAGFFATSLPMYALHFAGGYDNLLIVMLFAAVFASQPALAIAIGVLLGATHAEIGVLTGLQLLGLSWVGFGAPIKARLQLIGGVVIGRVLLMVWLFIDDAHGTRLDFAFKFGFGKLLHGAGRSWLLILWTAASGGWLIIATVLIRQRSKRLAGVVIGGLFANVVVVALSIDESRIASMSTMVILVALACYGGKDRFHAIICAIAVAVTFSVPYAAIYLGIVLQPSTPFVLGW